VALWLLVFVLASTALSGWMTWSAWKRLHMLSFPCWLLALVHGLTAGTDSGSEAAMAIYTGSAAAVAALAVGRIAGRARPGSDGGARRGARDPLPSPVVFDSRRAGG
jgi:sulfoxide reductase heme-binding subunit YedZ